MRSRGTSGAPQTIEAKEDGAVAPRLRGDDAGARPPHSAAGGMPSRPSGPRAAPGGDGQTGVHCPCDNIFMVDGDYTWS